LEHAHEEGVCHLDVRPENIIVDFGSDETSFKVQLGNWGCAQLMVNDEVEGFWGSLPFAYNEVHLKETSALWSPKPEYDFASLSFTMVALLGDLMNEIPWPKFFGMKVDIATLNRRRENSLLVINGSDLEEELETVLQSFLPPEEEESHYGTIIRGFEFDATSRREDCHSDD
jgi:serine/threonine protein kinase